jgi:hypothetical protein
VPRHGDSDIAQELVALQLAEQSWRNKIVVRLQSWIVQKALDRFGNRQLTPQEQQTVFNAMKKRWRVNLPDWWGACRT